MYRGFENEINNTGTSYIEKRRSKDRLLGAVRLAVNAVCALGILYFGPRRNMTMCLLLFPVAFLLSGLVDLIGKHDRYIDEKISPFMSVVLGGGLTAFILYHRNDAANSFGGFFDKHRIMPLIMGMMGAVLLIQLVVTGRIRAHRCTETVTASCVDTIVHRGGRGGSRYEYIWEFMYNGSVVRSMDRVLEIKDKYPVGSVAEIMVNPEDPMDIYRRSSSQNSLSVFICAAFVIFGILSALGVIY